MDQLVELFSKTIVLPISEIKVKHCDKDDDDLFCFFCYFLMSMWLDSLHFIMPIPCPLLPPIMQWLKKKSCLEKQYTLCSLS